MTKNDAKKNAEYVKSAFNHDLEPYVCDRCGLWHNAPKNRITPSEVCYSCTDRNGVPKDLYPTQAIAKKRAYLIGKDQGVMLKVYPCPSGKGFHLTKG